MLLSSGWQVLTLPFSVIPVVRALWKAPDGKTISLEIAPGSPTITCEVTPLECFSATGQAAVSTPFKLFA